MRRLLPLLLVCSLAPAVLAQSADLSVTVTAPATAVYGSSYPVYGEVVVTNAGPSAAQNVTIDLGPYSSQLFGENSSNAFLSVFHCGTANGRYTCTAASMAPGSLSALFYLNWPPAGNGTVETTTLTVSAVSPPDPNPANNTSSANTTVVWQASLGLTDVIAPSVAAGSSVTIVAFYGNGGPSPASDFKLTLAIPPGAQYSSYFSSEALACTEPPKGGSGDLVCTTPNLATTHDAYSSLQAIIHVDPGVAPGTVLTFPATITSTDAVHPSLTKSGSLTVLPSTHLHIEISAPATAFSGDTLQTTITVTNDGPAAGTDTYVSYSETGIYGAPSTMSGPPGWTCSSSHCQISSFAPGTATFTVATAISPLVKSATVVGTASANTANDPNSPSDFAKATTVITEAPPATLTLTLAASPDVVNKGDQLTYTATIANTSNADARNVKLQWSLPGTVTATTCGTINVAACTFDTIAAGATQTVTRTVHVDEGPTTVLTAQATASATNVAQPASATVVKTVAGTPHADLAVTILGPSGSVTTDSTSFWTYRVSNAGPDTAYDWQLSFVLPPNTRLVSSSIPARLVDGGFAGGEDTCTGLTPNAAGSLVTCHGTLLPAFAHVDLLVGFAVTEAKSIQASASVSTANVDPNPSNDSTTLDVGVFTTAHLAASLTTDKSPAVFGERVTQTLTLTNNGPDTATTIVVTLTLPAAPIGAIQSSAALSCIVATSIVCTAPALEKGAALTAAFSFLAPSQAGSWETRANMNWSTLGYGAGGVTAHFYFDVAAPPPNADLSVTLDATPATPHTGDAVAYTIAATNLGASPASNVAVQLNLPASLAFLSASPQCSGGPLVTCNAGTLSHGTQATFTVTARAVEAGTVKAVASVSTTSEESNNSNNTASATVVVTAPASTPTRHRSVHH